MLRRAPILLLFALAACKGGSDTGNEARAEAEAPAATILSIPGAGLMRCTPIGSARPAASALPLDLPKNADLPDVQMIFTVELHASGDMFVNSTRTADEAALLEQAREVVAKNKDVRAVIRADTSVTHGRVIHTLDMLKQAGISKIAFGTAASSPAGQ
jgi:biopolymer transport protein ExbD